MIGFHNPKPKSNILNPIIQSVQMEIKTGPNGTIYDDVRIETNLTDNADGLFQLGEQRVSLRPAQGYEQTIYVIEPGLYRLVSGVLFPETI